jgi:hypothetical protein
MENQQSGLKFHERVCTGAGRILLGGIVLKMRE